MAHDHCILCHPALHVVVFFFFFNDTATTEIYTLSLHDALPISLSFGEESRILYVGLPPERANAEWLAIISLAAERSEEHTSELQSRQYLVCRLLLEKKNHLPQSYPGPLSPGLKSPSLAFYCEAA